MRASQLPSAVSSGRTSASPWFPYLIDAAGKPALDVELTRADLLARLDTAIVAGFATHQRPSLYASATARLLRYPTLAARNDRALERSLLARAEHAGDPSASARAAAIGGSAMETLVHLVTTGVCRPHRLLALCGDLIETVDIAPAEFSRRLPRLVGILHEHIGDDDLISLLHRLRDTPTGQHDAAFELALAQLRAALDADDYPTIIDGLLSARRGFAAVISSAENRHDADAYAAAIDAIIAFNRRDVGPIRDTSQRLDKAVSQHAAWLAGCYRPPWMTSRLQEERAWHRLSVSLAAAVVPVSDDTWYHVDQALAALLDAYQSSRTFIRYSRAAPSAGVEELVRPVIEGIFIDNARNLSLLDRALVEDPQFQRNDVARQLRDAVRAAGTTAHSPSPSATGGDRLGKAIRRAPATLRYFRAEQAELLSSDCQPICNSIWRTCCTTQGPRERRPAMPRLKISSTRSSAS